MPANTAIPTPPRWTGDHEQDLALAKQWIADFHRATVQESGLLDTNRQFTPNDIVPESLPDPTNSSTADAQNVANAAYRKAFGL